jgi:hypothetical protein
MISRVMAFRRPILRTITVLALLAARVAFAEPNDEERVRAREAMSAGRAARDAKDLNSALQRFMEADAIMHVPTTGLEVAKTKAALGRLVEAREIARAVASSATEPGEPAPFQKARDAAAELATQLSRQVGTLRVAVSGPDDVDQISARLDGKEVDLDVLSSGLPVNPGQHRLQVEAGASRALRTFDVQAGQTQTVTLELSGSEPEPKPEPAARNTEPVDSLTATRSAKSVPTLSYVFAGVAVAAAANGVVFGLLGNQRRANLEHSCAPDCYESAVTQVKTVYTVADVSFAVGIGAAVTAIVAYATAPHPKDPQYALVPARPRLGFSLQAAPASAGLGLSGAF